MIIKNLPEEIHDFLTDASNFKGAAETLYYPENEEELITLIKMANKEGLKLTVAGNRTGLTGAAVPTSGGIVSLLKLDKIISIDKEAQLVRLQPAVVLENLHLQLKDLGLFYPPDPTETNCFIGGTIATNASGAKTFKYGPTRNFVEELKVILPTGDKVVLKRGECLAVGLDLTLTTTENKTISILLPDYKMPQTKNASGYFCAANMDAIDLFIGSEGTLGIITEAVLKVLPLPEDVLSAVAFFPDEESGLEFVARARAKTFANKGVGFDARALEYFDRNSLQFLHEEFPQVPVESGSGIWFEQEITAENSDDLIGEWFELIEECKGDTEKIWAGFDEADRKKIREFRHAISYKVNEYISRNNFRKLGTDVAVPDESFSELYFFGKELVKAEAIDYVLYGHFGNSHMHLNMLPKTEAQLLKGRELYKKICAKAIELNGTISAEHGVGKIKTAYLLDMYGADTIAKMKKLKEDLDPNMILCIGNIFE